MVRAKKSQRTYTYHMLRAAIAFVGAAMISWTVWKLLDNYLLPSDPFINSIAAILVGIVILLIDHFHLKELQ